MLKGIESPCLIVLSCVEIINAFHYGFSFRIAHSRKLRFSVGVGRPTIKQLDRMQRSYSDWNYWS